jgi:NADH-quinone oxidoreductase subunit N
VAGPLAQIDFGPVSVPDIAWSAIAPELLVAGMALVLLLLAVGGSYRLLVAGLGAVGSGGIGLWLVLDGLVVPGAVLLAVAAALVATVLAFEERPHLTQVWLAGAALAGGLALTGWQWQEIYLVAGPDLHIAGAVALDGIALFARIVILLAGLIALPMGHGYFQERGIYRPEFEPLLLFSITGMTVLAAAADLLVLFISIELLSFSLYVMIAMARRDRRAQEASLKYFLLGAVASAVLLYGIAMIYVATGTIDIGRIGTAAGLATTPLPVLFLGVALITVGLAFKAAAVPFHFWVPDVYQGSPTNITAFMAAATKAAAFAAVLRIYLVAFDPLTESWVPVLAAVAAVTMLVGALGAIVQRDIKRVLAYSSVAHVGFALVGVSSASPAGLSATLYYLLTYAVSALAAFGCVIAIERRRRGEVALVDLRGLGRRAPVLSAFFGLSLLSLAGIPATAGFTGKYAIFLAGVDAGLIWLLVIVVLASIIAAFFYLRLIGAMFLEEPEADAGMPILTIGLSAAIALAVTLVVGIGILPETFVTLADQAVSIAR